MSDLASDEIIYPQCLLKDLDDFYVDENRNWFIKTTNQRVHMKKAPSNDPHKIRALIEEYHQLLKFSNKLMQLPVGFYHPDDSNDYRLITLYAENQSLAEYMSTTKFLDSDTQKFLIISGIAYAMNDLHAKNVIHGRLCPSHILIDQEDEPILFNFGISRKCKDSSNSESFIYLAPELINGDNFTEKGDVYSFGLIVNQIYSETNIFTNYSLDEISRMKTNEEIELSSSIPENIVDIISECLYLDPNSRPTFHDIFNQFLRATFEMQCDEVISNYFSKISKFSKRKVIFRIPKQLLKLPQNDNEWNDKTPNPIDFDKLEKVVNPSNGKKAIIIMTIGRYEAGKSTFLKEITGNMAYYSGKGMKTQTLGIHIDGPYTKQDIVDSIFIPKFKTKINSLNLSNDTEIFFIDSQGLGDNMFSKFESVLEKIYPIFSAVSTICISVCRANDEESVRDVFKIIRRIKLMEVNFITRAVLLVRDYQPFNSMKDFGFNTISNFCKTFPKLYSESHSENIKYYVSEYISLLPIGDFKIYGQYLCSIWFDFYEILSMINENSLLPKPNVLIFLKNLSDSLFNRNFFLMKKFVIDKQKFKFKKIEKNSVKDKIFKKASKQQQNEEDNQELVQDQDEMPKTKDIEKVRKNIKTIKEEIGDEEEEIFEDIEFSKKQNDQIKAIDDYFQHSDGNSAEILHRCIRCSYFIASNVGSTLSMARYHDTNVDELYSALRMIIRNSVQFMLPFLIGDFDISVNDFYQYSYIMQKDINFYMAKNDKMWLEHMKNENNYVAANIAVLTTVAGSTGALVFPIAGEIIVACAYLAGAAMLLYDGIQSLIRKFIINDKFNTTLFPFIWNYMIIFFFSFNHFDQKIYRKRF